MRVAGTVDFCQLKKICVHAHVWARMRECVCVYVYVYVSVSPELKCVAGSQVMNHLKIIGVYILTML